MQTKDDIEKATHFFFPQRSVWMSDQTTVRFYQDPIPSQQNKIRPVFSILLHLKKY